MKQLAKISEQNNTEKKGGTRKQRRQFHYTGITTAPQAHSFKQVPELDESSEDSAFGANVGPETNDNS